MTSKPNNGLPIRATDDIRVFKVCITTRDGGILPYYMSGVTDLRYEKGKTYHQEHPLKIVLGKIYAGYHSYSAKKCHYEVNIENHFYRMTKGPFGIPKAIPSRVSVYGPKNIELDLYKVHNVFQHYFSGCAILDCVIPKGTVYYENTRGEIVSEVIRVDNIIEVAPCVG